MIDYLNYKFEDSPEFVSTFDELPLWSASFGLLLLKHVELKPNLKLLDIGSGSGFPLMELAGRLGSSCQLYGIDPWINANARTKQKIKNYGYKNVEVMDGSAEKIPFEDNSIDLIVSNLGINNFNQPQLVFKECNRVLKAGGKLALTTNLNGHWKEFYTLFRETLTELGKTNTIFKLRQDEEHRGTIESISKLFTGSGFKMRRTFEEQFEMRFLDGTAFLNHYFVKLGWLGSWKELMPEEDWKEVFSLLEKKLNTSSKTKGELKLTVPMAFMEGEKT